MTNISHTSQNRPGWTLVLMLLITLLMMPAGLMAQDADTTAAPVTEPIEEQASQEADEAVTEEAVSEEPVTEEAVTEEAVPQEAVQPQDPKYTYDRFAGALDNMGAEIDALGALAGLTAAQVHLQDVEALEGEMSLELTPETDPTAADVPEEEATEPAPAEADPVETLIRQKALEIGALRNTLGVNPTVQAALAARGLGVEDVVALDVEGDRVVLFFRTDDPAGAPVETGGL